MEAGLWVIRFYFHSSLLQKATCCSPRMLPVSHALTQSLHWASLMDRKGEKSSIYLPHWDIIRWFGMDGCSFGPEAITDPSKTVHANPRAATIWEGYRKSNRKTTRAGKVLKNPTRSEYIGRKTIPWKKTQIFCQFAGLRCQVLRVAMLNQSPTPCPRNTKYRGAVPSPDQETLTCSYPYIV